MRVFIGIELDSSVKNKLKATDEYLYQNGVRGNFTTKDNFHLTLEFIGEASYEETKKLKMIISEISYELFDLELESIGKFKDYIICYVKKTEELLTLQKDLRARLKEGGFKVENRDYFPHITIVRKPICVDDGVFDVLNKNIKMKSSVKSITLFESTRVNGLLKYVKIN